MTNFMRGLDAIARGMMILTAFCAFGMAFLILVEVTARASGIKFYGAAEYIRNMLIVIVFLQLPYAVRIQSMLSVDILVGSLPRKAVVPIAIFGCLMGVCFFGAVAAGAFGPAVDAWVDGEYEGEGVVDVPAWPAKFSIVVGCGFAAFYYFVRIVEIFKWGAPAAHSPDASAGF